LSIFANKLLMELIDAEQLHYYSQMVLSLNATLEQRAVRAALGENDGEDRLIQDAPART
jgi:hypothetical protein